MGTTAFTSLFKPDLATMGYGLFLAVNAAGVWGGVFPFIPLEFQTPDIIFWFFLAQASVYSVSYFASAIGSYWLPGPTRRFLVVLAAIPYFVGWGCLACAMYMDALAFPLFVSGGAFLGLGSAGFFMLWQRLFAGSPPDVGNRQLILGTAYASAIYFALHLIPSAVTVYLIPTVFLPTFGLAIIILSRDVDTTQSMFEDIPYEHPKVYRAVIHDYWRPALCVGALGLCAGIMRSLAIGDPSMGSLVNVLSMGASLVASIGLLVAWQRNSLKFNIVDLYHIVFPVAITAILLLPLLPSHGRWLAAILYATYSVATMLMMVKCAQASRDRGINPVFIYGFFGGIVYSLHEIGFLLGAWVESQRIMGIDPLAMVALATGYVMALMYFIGNGGFRRHRDINHPATIELVALRPTVEEMRAERGGRSAVATTVGRETAAGAGAAPAAAAQAAAGAAATSPAAMSDAPSTPPAAPATPAPALATACFGPSASERVQAGVQVVDRTCERVRRLQELYRLTAREADVVELVARGNTAVRIAEMLVVSESTIRTHTRRIYAKLDVHKKQELLDLLEQMA